MNPFVAKAGKYIFVEVDRQEKVEKDEDENAKEIALYPLQLKKVCTVELITPLDPGPCSTYCLLLRMQSYSLFGHRYCLLSSVHYYLDSEEGGGHYFTNVYAWGDDGGGDDRLCCVGVHEAEGVRGRFTHARKHRPDFDADAFLVALERVGEEGVISTNTSVRCSVALYYIFPEIAESVQVDLNLESEHEPVCDPAAEGPPAIPKDPPVTSRAEIVASSTTTTVSEGRREDVTIK